MDRLSVELGVPVVSSVAVRRGGTDALLAELDRSLAQPPSAGAAAWQPPDARELRGAQREADRILRLAVRGITAARQWPIPSCCTRSPASRSCSRSCS
jgi:ferrous iron transport protein B